MVNLRRVGLRIIMSKRGSSQFVFLVVLVALITISNITLYKKNEGQNYIQQEYYEDWKEVDGLEGSLFLYSAYYDARGANTVVRVIAIIRTNNVNVNGECSIITKGNQRFSTKISLQQLTEKWDYPYNTVFIECRNIQSIKDIPSRVYLTIKLNNQVIRTNDIKIKEIQEQQRRRKFTVCVRPFHNKYNEASRLVEFVELHMLLGVTKFFFYNQSTGSDVEKVVSYYVNTKIADFLPWSLPVPNEEIHANGQLAFINDCSLRNFWKTEHVIFVDVDEFILPKKHMNYESLISSLGNAKTYVFRNAFFYLNNTYGNRRKNDFKDISGIPSSAEGPLLLTASKIVRLAEPDPHFYRPKYIVKPDKVWDLGIHFVWKYLGKPSKIHVPSNVALVHHYRKCDDSCLIRENVTIDRTALKWTPLLHDRVQRTCKTIFTQRNLCPLHL